MKVKFGLQMKFTLLFVGLMLSIAGAVLFFLYKSYNELEEARQLNHAISVARIVESMVDEKELQRYADTGVEDENYNRLVEQMMRVQIRSGVYYLYVVVVETRERGTYIFDLKLMGEKAVLAHYLGQNNQLRKNYPGLQRILDAKVASAGFDRVKSEGEELDSIYVPILNDDGEVSAFVGVDFIRGSMAGEVKERIVKTMTALVSFMLLSLCILLLIIRFCVLRPVYRLKEHAEQVSEGNFHREIEVRGHDELSEIETVFNRMSKSIAENMEEMQRLNDAYYKYVPAKILPLLKKNSIMDVRLGNAENAMLTVFSLQLADFDRTIRKKSTREMIESINQVLQASVSVIAEKEGMIEGFQHAGFTALFDSGGEAALLSAVTICQKLNRMVQSGHLEKNRVGIGIAYGEVTLGIVGQEKRMAAVTVSQYKDTACWLQQIADRYQSHILITQTAAGNITGFYDTYHSRTLGFLYNSYTGYTDRIYDVYDGDAKEEMELKDATKEDFEQGVELYCIRDFPGARRKFIAVLKRFRKDKAAKEYLYLCDKNCRQENRHNIAVYFTEVE